MTAPQDRKTAYLVAYDYGMGGLWGVIVARSAEEILAQYPELSIVSDRPKWMSDDEYERIAADETHDIDGAPWGMLNAVIDERDAR